MRGFMGLALGALGIAGVLLAPGCRRAELSGPPTLKLGRDECAECGMIVTEDRFSSAVLAEKNGAVEHLLFDDVGCMIDYGHAHEGEVRVIEAFAHDYDSRLWVSCGDAAFLFADRGSLRTPMSSGIGAFAEEGAAERAREEFGGEVLSYSELVAARLAWREETYGKPKGE